MRASATSRIASPAPLPAAQTKDNAGKTDDASPFALLLQAAAPSKKAKLPAQDSCDKQPDDKNADNQNVSQGANQNSQTGTIPPAQPTPQIFATTADKADKPDADNDKAAAKAGGDAADAGQIPAGAQQANPQTLILASVPVPAAAPQVASAPANDDADDIQIAAPATAQAPPMPAATPAAGATDQGPIPPATAQAPSVPTPAPTAGATKQASTAPVTAQRPKGPAASKAPATSVPAPAADATNQASAAPVTDQTLVAAASQVPTIPAPAARTTDQAPAAPMTAPLSGVAAASQAPATPAAAQAAASPQADDAEDQTQIQLPAAPGAKPAAPAAKADAAKPLKAAANAKAPATDTTAPDAASTDTTKADSDKAADVKADLAQTAANSETAKPAPQPVQATSSNMAGIAAPQALQPASAPILTQHIQVTAQPIPNMPALAVTIAAKAQSGARQFDIRLDPPELGRVDVRLSIDATGKASAHLSADQPQTLDLLQKDSASLTRALRDAGLNMSQDGLNFSLRQQAGGHDGGQAGGQPGGHGGRSRTFSLTATTSIQATATSVTTRGVADGRLDIRV